MLYKTMHNIREKINPVRSKTPEASADMLSAGRTSNGIKPTLNKILCFLLLIGIAFSFTQIARAESISEFLQEFLQPSAPIEENQPPVAQTFATDKTFYELPEIIKISGAPPGSAIEIYWLDNPDTAINPDPESRPSNVVAALVGDDGTINIDAYTLPAGRLVFVNTFEPEHCGGFYLSQCRARSDYLGEVEINIQGEVEINIQ